MIISAVVLASFVCAFLLTMLMRLPALGVACGVPLAGAACAFLAITLFPSGGSTEPVVVPLLLIIVALGAVPGAVLAALRRRGHTEV
jgi:CHASE2 domain-containing sensor protein